MANITQEQALIDHQQNNGCASQLQSITTILYCCQRE
ncbi:hypothetical protein T07_3796 [Trichinella nelsoni]|uniref:Uncharacterized protein n=1 Tax=Trichinella nelsoni TaxID=6336 RepID=A0A0V0RCZ1_9BILA|nr:hypothetical protein T07_3796 [Trichinella nelsoni]